jgi:acetyl esterase/lipase
MRLKKQLAVIAAGFAVLASVPQASAQDPREVATDVVYGSVGERDLLVDIYMPRDVEAPGLVVWVHGGAWRGGSKANPPMAFVDAGYALASLDFHLSPEAGFPAQIHDIKGAIRFLRAHAPEYGYRTDRIAIAGASSGAHLASLVGVTNGHKELEGTVGGNLDVPSDVQAIVSYYAATNLRTILDQSTPFGLGVREPALDLFIGGHPDEVPEVAELASPVTHVDSSDPPLLLLHGDQDPQMPINQGHELEGRYEEFGLDVYFDIVHGSRHGGPAFYEGRHLTRMVDFLDRVIGK